MTERARHIEEALEFKSADGLATEAREDFAYAEVSANPENRAYWMARAATHAGLAAHKAIQELTGRLPEIVEPVSPGQTADTAE